METQEITADKLVVGDVIVGERGKMTEVRQLGPCLTDNHNVHVNGACYSALPVIEIVLRGTQGRLPRRTPGAFLGEINQAQKFASVMYQGRA